MNCRNCGNAMEPNEAVCPNCGCERNTEENPNAKSKLAAGLLGIFLGFLGAHNFYLGYYGKAWGQLWITLLSLGTLSFISGIWGLIEGIMYLAGAKNTDGNGIPLIN